MKHDVVVVGGGISGLVTAHRLRRRQRDLDLNVLERESAPGGTIRSTVQDGYTIDWGPNGFLANAPETLQLVDELGLTAELQPAADAAKKRYLFTQGALHPVPTGPKALIKSGLLLPSEKLRLLGDLFIRPAGNEETVFDFAARRFGQRAASIFAKPVILGITAGDAARTSLDALFPRIRRMEQEHGSLLRAMMRGRKRSDTGARLGGRLTGFARGGMQRLIDALNESLAAVMKTGAAVTAIERSAGRYLLTLADGNTMSARIVVLATPAADTALLLKDLAPAAARRLKEIPYAGVRVVALGYHRVDVPNALDGFGFLVAEDEQVSSLGVLYTSSIFPEQAPEGRVLLRVMTGGVRDPAVTQQGRKEALAQVQRDLRIAMGITAEPELTFEVNWPRAIPQYEPGHQQRIADVMNALPPGLHLTGNAYHGVGVNDCVQAGNRVADQVIAAADVK